MRHAPGRDRPGAPPGRRPVVRREARDTASPAGPGGPPAGDGL